LTFRFIDHTKKYTLQKKVTESIDILAETYTFYENVHIVVDKHNIELTLNKIKYWSKLIYDDGTNDNNIYYIVFTMTEYNNYTSGRDKNNIIKNICELFECDISQLVLNNHSSLIKLYDIHDSSILP